MHVPRPLLAIPAAVLLAGLFLTSAGCAPAEEAPPEEAVADTLAGRFVVRDAWARPGPAGGMSAAYLVIANGTAEADTLVGAASDVAELVEIHETYEQEGGMMGMRHAPPVAVPPGGEVFLAPRGLHVMLVRLHRDLAPGDTVVLDLRFAHRTVSVECRVGASPVGP